jgi:hypothetical protein
VIGWQVPNERDPEVFGCHSASIGHFFVLDDLPFIERGKASPFKSRDVHKYILAAALRLNESIALGEIEPLHSAFRHICSNIIY